MQKWTMIGIRVPHDSDIPARLKEASKKTRLSYGELIDQWLKATNLPPPGQLSLFSDQQHTKTDDQAQAIDDLQKRLSEQAEVMAALQEMIVGLSKQSQIQPEKELQPKQERVKEPREADVKNKNYAEAMTRALELRAEGKSLQEIADVLNAEGFSNKSGRGGWFKKSVSAALKQINQ